MRPDFAERWARRTEARRWRRWLRAHGLDGTATFNLYEPSGALFTSTPIEPSAWEPFSDPLAVHLPQYASGRTVTTTRPVSRWDIMLADGRHLTGNDVRLLP